MATSASQGPLPGGEPSVDSRPSNPNANTVLLRKLSRAVDGQAATATFACGGAVPISNTLSKNLRPKEQTTCPPVMIRWDAQQPDLSSKIVFPLEDDEISITSLNTLLEACQPATFGVGGRDVLDEGYRKAGKLDRSVFSTDFHPHDCGIVDSIDQILLPGTLKCPQGFGIGPQGIRAELYKLNIYSAPSGGTLRVKHRGQTADFSWQHADLRSIPWAAFYGDCEHEVLEVTKGHRITLTYNLYYSRIGQLARPISSPDQLPLYPIVRNMLELPEFMQQGGTLGFSCHHQYAHSTEYGSRLIPAGFKGVDLAIYSVFTSLGLRVGVHPIVQNKCGFLGGMLVKRLFKDSANQDETERTSDHVQDFLERLKKYSMEPHIDNHDSDYEEEDEYDYIEYKQLHDFGTPSSWSEGRPEYATRVGTALHGPTFDEVEYENSREPVSDKWPHRKVSQIVWMNEPLHKEFAYAGLAYGNEASLNYQFSAAAILVVVAPSAERIKRISTLKRPRERTLSPECNSPSTIEAPSPSNVDTPPESNSNASENAPMAETWVRQPHALSGYMVNREGRVVNECNEIIGLVTHGHLGSVAGRKVDRDGYIFNEYGEMLGEAMVLR